VLPPHKGVVYNAIHVGALHCFVSVLFILVRDTMEGCLAGQHERPMDQQISRVLPRDRRASSLHQTAQITRFDISISTH